MKNWITQLVGLCAAILVFSSCEKDEIKATVQPGTAPSLTVSQKTLTLSADKSADEATTFKWTPGEFGFQAAQQYTLQFDKRGGNFSAPKTISLPAGATSYKATVKDLNNIFNGLGLPAGSESSVDVRLVSVVDAKIKTLASTVTTLTGTPYAAIVVYPTVWVPGSYQGWTPATAPTLAAFTTAAQKYEGYLYFPDATTMFKITGAPEWSDAKGIYGDAGDGTTGKVASPGADFKVTGAGYYQLRIDLGELTFLATKTTWGVIGSATPGAWSTDTPMTYDPATKLWSVTTTLAVGEIKFRANNDWAINFGDGKKDDGIAADGLLDYSGDNIAIAEPGNYTITMDLSNAGNFQYKLTKN
ncbi:SusF/SusE family outer membrane protein [Hymenobacter sp. BT18]|uniref:SusE domain-containing protein n=1 Tax=Hymenobacter sp. BT18 TaxID=2835648 RepID=UPI00143E220D|nr:SusE domain-containing protein [Hymenobacter sp. BT18]QIX62972.1 SusF/SusE family outer membrane protein [Hymenobacter sp. BT18]